MFTRRLLSASVYAWSGVAFAATASIRATDVMISEGPANSNAPLTINAWSFVQTVPYPSVYFLKDVTIPVSGSVYV